MNTPESSFFARPGTEDRATYSPEPKLFYSYLGPGNVSIWGERKRKRTLTLTLSTHLDKFFNISYLNLYHGFIKGCKF